METIEVCYKGSVLNRFKGDDAMKNAREDAVDHAVRNGVRIQVVNATPGEPRYLLAEFDSSGEELDDLPFFP